VKVKIAVRAAVVAAALLGGAIAVPGSASAAQWNSFKQWANPSDDVIHWEDYTRSHTSTGDIKFDGLDGQTLGSAWMYLKYDSNGNQFAAKKVGAGSTTLVSNWGATRFHVGVRSDGLAVQGYVQGSLYY
jgi:hypothetical protein